MTEQATQESIYESYTDACSTLTDLIVIGAGGGTRELLPFLDDINRSTSTDTKWKVVGILDDDSTLHGTQLANHPILGSIDRLAEFPDARIIIAIASQREITIRRRLFDRIGLPLSRYATLVHPRAYVAPTARISEGCVIYPHVSIGPGTSIGHNSVIYFNSVLHHDTAINAHCAVCAGVVIAGGCRVGECAYLGAGCCLRDGVNVSDECLVGMGAVVTRDVAAGTTVCGVPARKLRRDA